MNDIREPITKQKSIILASEVESTFRSFFVMLNKEYFLKYERRAFQKYVHKYVTKTLRSKIYTVVP